MLLGLLALGILWLGLTFHLGLREKVAGDIARRDAANLTIALEEQVQRTFSGIDQLLLLAKAEAEEDLARFSLVKWVGRVPFPDELALQAMIADAQGTIRGTSPAGGEPRPTSVADREAFRIHVERSDAGLFISRLAPDPLTGRWSVQVSRRLNEPSGAFAGVLILSIDPGYLARRFASLNVGARGSVTLVGRDGYLRARTPDLPGMYERGLREEFAASGLAAPAERGNVTIASGRSPVDGVERVFAYRVVGDLPLVVSVGLSTEEMLAPVHRERRRALVLGGAVSFVLCLFILILLTELETRRRNQEDLARANRALADNEARYRLLADNTTDVIARVGLDGTLRYLSPSCVAVTGFAPEELVGRKSSSLIHPDDRPHVEEHFRRLLAAGPEAPRTSLAFRARHKDGSWTWLEINPTVLVDPATGAPSEFIDVVRNISRRKEIEAELRQKTSLLEATLEHMDQGLVMIDSHGTVAVSNRRAIELLDLPVDFMASKPSYLEIRRRKVAEGEYSASDQAFQDWIAGGGLMPAQQTYERIRPNGTALEVRTVPLADGGVVRTYSDITYRKRAEQALTRSEARFRLLAENASDIIMLRRLGGQRIYVSPASQAMLGYSPETFLGMRREDVIHPDDLPRIRAIYDELSPQRPTITDMHRLKHRDGHWVWVEAVFRLTEDDGLPTVLVAIRDVSDRHAQSAELEAAKDRAEVLLAQAEQASQAKSDFLASMSHEIRTPLNSILGFTDLLLDDYDLPPEARRLLQQVQGSGTALLTVVNDILDFSKIEAGQIELDPKPTHIASLVENVISIIRGVATKKKLELQVSLDPPIPCTVVADGDRLRQVLLNLVNNAVKFTARGHIALRVRHLGSSDAGERIRFEVEDTGIGIPSDKQPRLFERFSQVDSSIRRHFGGTGLGLAICKQLIGLMQGTI
ncbi:MAG TPA: PAS domain S-box protein, partial [Microvirga sp.]|nr:PAS domain S-box protein [Microvirga sp.]